MVNTPREKGGFRMNAVEPIRDPKAIAALKARLYQVNRRNAAWFTLGINTGLRIGDLLRIRVGDVRPTRKQWMDRLIVIEQKTGKRKDPPLSPPMKQALQEYLATRPEARATDPLFPSQRGGRPLTRQAAKAVGITEPIGTHTMRKSWGYHARKAGIDLTIIQDVLNHSDHAITYRYLGIDRYDRDQAYQSLNF